MGGRFTYEAAVSGLDIQAAAGFYGAGIGARLAAPTCPLLLFFGDDDEYVPAEEIAAAEAQHPGQVVVYPGAPRFMATARHLRRALGDRRGSGCRVLQEAPGCPGARGLSQRGTVLGPATASAPSSQCQGRGSGRPQAQSGWKNPNSSA
jgi:dienelactone hydrolase